MEGDFDGDTDGDDDGIFVGKKVGDGDTDGADDGFVVGSKEGDVDGVAVGTKVGDGDTNGDDDGFVVGTKDGVDVGALGIEEDNADGEVKGEFVLFILGSEFWPITKRIDKKLAAIITGIPATKNNT